MGSHIIRDRLQRICLTVLQQTVPDDVMALLSAARLNTELFVSNAIDDGDNSEYIEQKQSVQSTSRLLSSETSNVDAQVWMKRELFASLADKGDVDALLSAFASLDTLLRSDSNRSDAKWKDFKSNAALRQQQIFLEEAISRFLAQCSDIKPALVVMDKLLHSPIGQRATTFGTFLRMLDVGIAHPSPTSHWFQIKALLGVFLAAPQRSITSIDIFDKLIEYTLAHNDIVGLSDALQMLLDSAAAVTSNSKPTSAHKLSSSLLERIMEKMALKSSDAALHLFQRLSAHSEPPTFRCLFWVLRACAEHADALGLDTVRDLMVANGIAQRDWDTATYNAILKCNAHGGEAKIGESLQLLDDLL